MNLPFFSAIRFFCSVIAFIFFLFVPLKAQSPLAEFSLFASSSHLENNSFLALKVKIKDGWHGSAPGSDSAPQFEWKLPPGLELGEVQALSSKTAETWFLFRVQKNGQQRPAAGEISLKVFMPLCQEKLCSFAEKELAMSFPFTKEHLLGAADLFTLENEINPKADDLSWDVLLIILGGAFLGGILLNLMPCVLPVLSLKVFSLLKKKEIAPKIMRIHGLVFMGGVLASFLTLVLILMIVKSYTPVHWGFQLHVPHFVISLILLFTILALNLFGVFEMGVTLTRFFPKAVTHEYWGTFFEGVLITLVSTPCTAPFMGSALAVAFSTTVFKSFLIFLFLGLGISFPFLLLCFFPRWLKWLPQSGQWMQTLKQFLGFPLLLTTLWMLWVYGQQSTLLQLFQVFLGIFLVAMGLWFYGQSFLVRSPYLLRIFFSGFVVLGGYLAFTAPLVQKQDALWQPYDPKKIEKLEASHSPYFIQFTAHWCLTCQTNNKLVLQDPEVLKGFKDKNIQLFSADYTNRDPVITKALEKYKKIGVPSYVFFAGHKFIDLPEILSKGAIAEVLD